MENAVSITEDLYYLGASDRRIALFESAFPVPRGVSYNSYLLKDEKTVLFDTVDAAVAEEFLHNLEGALGGKKLDYLIVHHVEPDHSASFARVLQRYPDTAVIASAKAAVMLKNFFSYEGASVVKEGDVLETGKHRLRFLAAPMVHWPEVLFTYDETAGTLFSADAFGTFGALGGSIFADEVHFERDYLDDARRYYFNIVGKYGMQVQALLKKASALDIETICPLHGPVLKENLSYYIGKYQTWSSYEPEDKGVFVAYASIHGNTAKAAEYMAEQLREKGAEKVVVCDLAREDMAEAVEDAFRYDRIVLAASTYDGGIFTWMEEFLHHLKAKNFQKRKAALIENGSWAPAAAKQMRAFLETMKDVEVLEQVVTVKSALSEANKEEIERLAESLCTTTV